VARETLTQVKAERDAALRRVDELYELSIRLSSAVAMAKRILEDALDRVEGSCV